MQSLYSFQQPISTRCINCYLMIELELIIQYDVCCISTIIRHIEIAITMGSFGGTWTVCHVSTHIEYLSDRVGRFAMITTTSRCIAGTNVHSTVLLLWVPLRCNFGVIVLSVTNLKSCSCCTSVAFKWHNLTGCQCNLHRSSIISTKLIPTYFQPVVVASIVGFYIKSVNSKSSTWRISYLTFLIIAIFIRIVWTLNAISIS